MPQQNKKIPGRNHMDYSSSVVSIIATVILTFHCISHGEAQSQGTPILLHHECPNTTVFSPNGTYRMNRDALLSSLTSSNSTEFIAGFANRTTGQAYGLFLCRGDLYEDTCRACVATARQDILQKSPVQMVSIIWYDQCMLSNSNRPIFSTVRVEPTVTLVNGAKISDPARFLPLMNKTMAGLISAAAAASSQSSGKKFAAEKVEFPANLTSYMFLQCTPDLTPADCTKCLQMAVKSLPQDGQDARVLFPSCNVRYESYPFYDEKAITIGSSPASVDEALSPPSLSPPPPPAVPMTEPMPNKGKRMISRIVVIATVIPVVLIVVMLSGVWYGFHRKITKRSRVTGEASDRNEMATVGPSQFDFATIQAATRSFSVDTKLGEGGFGEVYKVRYGVLPNGQEVAIKRLSTNYGHGAEQFKNEVMVVGKLQHRNLVGLIEFCSEGEEKIIVYEYVANKSLDHYFQEPERRCLLDWPRRCKIIIGIIRGMVYLHEDSKLRIIHRDLKSSNVLLDGNMEPKVSDFSTARIFGVDQTRQATRNVIGTYGYMPLEYVVHRQFSVKSDVYSFGILVLEIISGQKNSSFYQTGYSEDLPNHAWKHWTAGMPLEVVDPILNDSCSWDQVIRCIHISLLCFQKDPADRPSMATVAHMLNTPSITLPVPSHPAFFFHSITARAVSMNEASDMEVDPR